MELNWDDKKGNILLTENSRYIFSVAIRIRVQLIISQLSLHKWSGNNWGKQGRLFAIRVDRAFEMPSNESLIFTDDKGNPTTVKATDNTGVTGMYTSSKG